MPIKTFIFNLQAAFQRAANPNLAEPMSAYMRHQFPFLGIKSPVRRDVSRPFFKSSKMFDFNGIIEICYLLWGMPEREFQYFGVDLLLYHRKSINPKIIDFVEYVAHDKSWWDTIDLIASNAVGHGYKNGAIPLEQIERWNQSDNLWLNRVSIIFQLNYRNETDWPLLKTMMLPHLRHPDFFIQKAIGWALRQYSKCQPHLVIEFADQHQLSGLAQREALRIINKQYT